MSGLATPVVCNRFPIDILLRKHGFEVWERAVGKEVVWKKGRLRNVVLFTQSEALLRVPHEEIADAEYEEALSCGDLCSPYVVV